MKLKFSKKYWPLGLALLLFVVALIIRLSFAWFLPNNEPYDGVVYSQIARNVLEHKIYSTDVAAPYSSTYIRVPGYPMFLAIVYTFFGHQNDSAVRIIQAFIDSLTCLLIACLAIIWLPESWRKKRKQVGLVALGLAVFSPFLIIYVTTLLTETITVFLLVTFTILISQFIKNKNNYFLFFAGIIGGLMTMMRPDSGFFVLAGGLILIIATLKWYKLKLFIKKIILTGVIFTFGFIIILAPWTIRNWQIFHVFMPIAPSSASMPDQFYASGYDDWVKTWATSDRYTDYAQWSLDTEKINIDGLPEAAFNSSLERDRVQKLFDLYNNPDQDENPNNNVYMSPTLDAEFGQLAKERVSENPFKFYFILPAKRAVSLWFDTHSQFYPFSGRLFPLQDLSVDNNQNILLPIFFLLILFLSIGLVAGSIIIWQYDDYRLMIVFLWLLIIPRLIFLATLSHPEPRYTVEYFPLMISASAIAVITLANKCYNHNR